MVEIFRGWSYKEIVKRNKRYDCKFFKYCSSKNNGVTPGFAYRIDLFNKTDFPYRVIITSDLTLGEILSSEPYLIRKDSLPYKIEINNSMRTRQVYVEIA